MMAANINTADREIVITRLLNAPRVLVYEAWTNPRHVINWWGPNGFTNTFKGMEVKQGGVWEFMMHGPDGTNYPNRITYKEVVVPEKLVYTHDSGVDNDPKGFDVTITFEEQGDKTMLTMRSLFATAEERNTVVMEYGAIEGGNQTVNKLEEYLATMQQPVTIAKEFTVTRIFSAPREVVFMAWIDPIHASRWWGPSGFTNPVFEWNPLPGGTILVHMQGPDGVLYPMSGMFLEVSAPGMLVYAASPLDDKGNRVFEVMNTVEFLEYEGGTKMVISAIITRAGQGAAQYLDRMDEGWKQSMEKLSAEVVKMHGTQTEEEEMVITRVLDAPRELVFKAWTDADSLAQWWGPKEMKITALTLDLRPGGTLHYCMGANGFEMWGKFVYHEIVAPEHIVFVSSFSDKDGNIVRAPFSAEWPLEVRNVLTLTEHGGKTTLTLRGGPVNATDKELKLFRDMRGSMQQGFNGTFSQLDEFLVQMKKTENAI